MRLLLWFKYELSKEVRCSHVVKSVSDKQPRKQSPHSAQNLGNTAFPFGCASSLRGVLENSIQASGSPSGWPWAAAPAGIAKAIGCIPSERHRMDSRFKVGGSGRYALLLLPPWSGQTYPAIVFAPENIILLKHEILWQNFTHF